jgi:hypothetical protein
MTHMLAQPQLMSAAAADAAGIGSAINDAHAAAAGSTTGVVSAAADEVSAATATLFNTYAQQYQAISRQAAAFHADFTQALAAASNAYANAESANATAMSTGSSAATDETLPEELVQDAELFIDEIDTLGEDAWAGIQVGISAADGLPGLVLELLIDGIGRLLF